MPYHVQSPSGAWYDLTLIEGPGRLSLGAEHDLTSSMTPDEIKELGVDGWHIRFSRIWEYWITTPTDLLGDVHAGGVKDFVATAGEGSLPADWAEKDAETVSGVSYTVCTFTASMGQVRSLGSAQRSLQTLPEGEMPATVHFFERVADIPDFGGMEKTSRQPTTIDKELYAPTELYQTSHPDAAEDRGSSFTEADVLDTTGLILV